MIESFKDTFSCFNSRGTQQPSQGGSVQTVPTQVLSAYCLPSPVLCTLCIQGCERSKTRPGFQTETEAPQKSSQLSGLYTKGPTEFWLGFRTHSSNQFSREGSLEVFSPNANPSMQETEAGGLLWVIRWPGLHGEFQANLSYRVRSCLNLNEKAGQGGTGL